VQKDFFSTVSPISEVEARLVEVRSMVHSTRFAQLEFFAF
jgi:hypothetical protein